MNVFIDLGSHKGKIIRKFMASKLYSPDFVIHAFEVSPVLPVSVFEHYPKGVIIHKSAAWTSAGELEFYVCPTNKESQGPSVFKEKTTGNLDKGHPVKVKCFDFSSWLKSKFAPTDNIIVKCNIEGAEYPIFRHLWEQGTIGYIKKLFLRTHWNKIGMPKEEHDEFMAILGTAVEVHGNYDF
jgi:FkbM family methyltransferase